MWPTSSPSADAGTLPSRPKAAGATPCLITCEISSLSAVTVCLHSLTSIRAGDLSSALTISSCQIISPRIPAPTCPSLPPPSAPPPDAPDPRIFALSSFILFTSNPTSASLRTRQCAATPSNPPSASSGCSGFISSLTLSINALSLRLFSSGVELTMALSLASFPSILLPLALPLPAMLLLCAVAGTLASSGGALEKRLSLKLWNTPFPPTLPPFTPTPPFPLSPAALLSPDPELTLPTLLKLLIRPLTSAISLSTFSENRPLSLPRPVTAPAGAASLLSATSSFLFDLPMLEANGISRARCGRRASGFDASYGGGKFSARIVGVSTVPLS